MRLAIWLRFPALLATLACAACATQAVQAGDAGAVALRGHVFSVEVATTEAQQEHGLMDRTAMAPDHGMLFVFRDAKPRTFWMKNTLIPLDILYFDNARRLVSVQANAQPCRADPCPFYPSNEPARYVLELNAGTAARIGARTGDLIEFIGRSTSGTQ